MSTKAVIDEMSPFPPTWKFKTFYKRQRRKYTLSVANIIENSLNADDCLTKIGNISKRKINAIERRTIIQAKNEDWFFYRKGLITGTITCRVSNSVKKGISSDTVNASISKREYLPLYYPAVVWGRDSEELGIAAFIKTMKPLHYNLKVSRAGLRLDESDHFIGASIDGLVECSCCESAILEVKCPYSIRDGTVADNGKNLQYLTDDLKLKQNHPYYYQLQTYLGVYKCKLGYFCVYTPRDVLILRIDFDENFWKNLKKDLRTYYEHHYLKDIFSVV